MSSEFLKILSSDNEWLAISRKFEEKWNYPHALGAIDGKHVRIQKPKNGGSLYYNYKHHSITLIAMKTRVAQRTTKYFPISPIYFLPVLKEYKFTLAYKYLY